MTRVGQSKQVVYLCVPKLAIEPIRQPLHRMFRQTLLVPSEASPPLTHPLVLCMLLYVMRRMMLYKSLQGVLGTSTSATPTNLGLASTDAAPAPGWSCMGGKASHSINTNSNRSKEASLLI